MRDGVGQAVRCPVQIPDAVQHGVDMGFEQAEFVMRTRPRQAGVQLAFGHTVGQRVDPVDPGHDRARRETANQRARNKKCVQKAQHCPPHSRQRLVHRAQAAPDHKRESPRQFACNHRPSGTDFHELTRGSRGKAFALRRQPRRPARAGACKNGAATVHQQKHLVRRCRRGALVDGLAQRDDPALVMQRGKSVKIGR